METKIMFNYGVDELLTAHEIEQMEQVVELYTSLGTINKAARKLEINAKHAATLVWAYRAYQTGRYAGYTEGYAKGLDVTPPGKVMLDTGSFAHLQKRANRKFLGVF